MNSEEKPAEVNIYAPPSADSLPPLPPTEQGVGSDLASRWARLGACLVDSIILIIPSLGTFFLALFLSGHLFSWLDEEEEGFFQVWFLTAWEDVAIAVIILLFFLLINGWCYFRNGQTLGKKLLKIAIVDGEGRKPTVGKLWARLLFFSFIDLVPFLGTPISLANALFIFGGQRRCLHDLIASTKVVKVQKG